MDDELLAELVANPDDEATRMVYQDWLDENGDQRGEYLRLQSKLSHFKADDPQREPVRQELQKVHGEIAQTWRDWLLKVSRSQIEHCPGQINSWFVDQGTLELADFRFGRECPRRWANLESTDDPTIRYCDQGRKHVFFCDDVREAESLSVWGQCVAVDESVLRQDCGLFASNELVFGGLFGRVKPKRLEEFEKRAAQPTRA